MKEGQELVNIYCPIVISNAGLFNTYEYLLPEKARCLPGKLLGCVTVLQGPQACPLQPAGSALLVLPPALRCPLTLHRQRR